MTPTIKKPGAGRPRLGNTHKLVLRLSPEVHAQLQARAKAAQKPLSELIRETLAKAI
jgi:predicted HicB family RNase H-like nuclease